MAEPHTTVATAAIISALASAPPLLILGAQADALVIGLLAAVFVSIHMHDIDNKLRAASAVLFSSMLAGFGSPVAAAWLVDIAPSVSGSPDAVRLLLAFVIGAAAPTVVPLAIRALGKKVDGAS